MAWLKEKAKGLLSDYNENERVESLEGFRNGLRDTWGQREITAVMSAVPETRRVIVIRHGMGEHNESKQMGSLMARDASLNAAGVTQAREVGQALAHLLPHVGLVVTSPFLRAIQTGVEFFEGAGDTTEAMSRAVITPLCAEHTFLRSNLGQGDRGSTVTELNAHPYISSLPYQLDFTLTDEYIANNGIPDGKWWYHSPQRNHETPESFSVRAIEFRRWLGQQVVQGCAPSSITLVFSHGGLLCETFGLPRYHNAEFRTFLVAETGEAMRLARVEKRVPPAQSTNAATGVSRRAAPAVPSRGPPRRLRIVEEPAEGPWRVGQHISVTIEGPPGDAVQVALMKEKAMNRPAEQVVLLRQAAPLTGRPEVFHWIVKPAHMGRGNFAGKRFLEVRAPGATLRTAPQVCFLK